MWVTSCFLPPSPATVKLSIRAEFSICANGAPVMVEKCILTRRTTDLRSVSSPWAAGEGRTSTTFECPRERFGRVRTTPLRRRSSFPKSAGRPGGTRDRAHGHRPYRSQDQGVTAAHSERVYLRVTFSPTGNKRTSWTVVRAAGNRGVRLFGHHHQMHTSRLIAGHSHAGLPAVEHPVGDLALFVDDVLCHLSGGVAGADNVVVRGLVLVDRRSSSLRP